MLPIERPGKVICVGLNYRGHAEEQGAELPERPILCAKWPTALTGPGDPIVLPQISSEIDYEAELAVVIGTRVRGVDSGEALEAVRSYACANDVTARAAAGRPSVHAIEVARHVLPGGRARPG